jgi:hypothetical protein
MKKKVTLIIPHKEKTPRTIEPLLQNIQKWTSYPDEIIIINSSSFKLKINFFFNFCIKKKISLLLVNNLDGNPGFSRNHGILKSKNKIICFLDVQTIPQDNWFKRGFHRMINSNLDCILGQTFYKANNYKEKIIRASTYGCRALITIPGSFFRKNIFDKIGLFIGSLRSGEDTDLIKRIYLQKLNVKKSEINVTYTGLIGTGYFKIILKWKKNYKNVLEMPYFQSHKFIYVFFLLIILFYISLTWNWLFASWDENNIFYIPNVTKMILITLLLIYFSLRSLIIPIQKKVQNFLFPFNFLLVFLFSFILDIIKMYVIIKNLLFKIFTYLNSNKSLKKII